MGILSVLFNSEQSQDGVIKNPQHVDAHIDLEDVVEIRQRFRDSLRSAWLTVSAITFANNNGLEGLPNWGLDIDFSLFDIADKGDDSQMGGNLLDLLDFAPLRAVFSQVGELQPGSEHVTVRIEGLQIENQGLEGEASDIVDSGNASGNVINGDSATITFIDHEGKVVTNPVDVDALSALLAARLAYQLLVLQTREFDPAVANQDFLEIQTLTQAELAALAPVEKELVTTFEGNVLENDTKDVRAGALSVISVLNERRNVDNDTSITYPNDTLADPNLSFGVFNLNAEGDWTFELNIDDPTVIGMDDGESIPIYVPYIATDGLLRTQVLVSEKHLELYDEVIVPPSLDFVLGGFSHTTEEAQEILEDFLKGTPFNVSALTITLSGINDAPATVDDLMTIGADFTEVTYNLLDNDTDPDIFDVVNGNQYVSDFSINVYSARDADDNLVLVNPFSGIGALPRDPGTLETVLFDLEPGETTSEINNPMDLGVTYSVTADGVFTVTSSMPQTYLQSFDTDKSVDLTFLYNIDDTDLPAPIPGVSTLIIEGVNDAPTAFADVLEIDDAVRFTGANMVNLLTGKFETVGIHDPEEEALGNKQIGGSFNYDPLGGVIGRDDDLDTNVLFSDRGEADMFLLNDVSTGNLRIYSVTDNNGNEFIFGDAADFANGAEDTDFFDNIDTGVGLARVYHNGDMEFIPFEDLKEGGEETRSIQYRLTDGDALSAPVPVEFTVIGANTAPVAIDDEISLNENQIRNVDLLDNDFDPDVGEDEFYVNITIDGVIHTMATGDAVAFEFGTISVTNAGVLTYSPSQQLDDPDAQVEVRFEYTIEDPNGATDTADFIAIMQGVNDAPEAFSDAITVNEEGMSSGNVIGGTVGAGAAASLIRQDMDVDLIDKPILELDLITYDGEDIRFDSADPIVLVTPVGTINIDKYGDFEFTPSGISLPLGTSDFDILDYRVTDGDETSTGRLTFTTQGINNNPVAVDDIVNIVEDTVAADNTINLLTNGAGDFDPDTGDTIGATGDVISYSGINLNDGFGERPGAISNVTTEFGVVNVSSLGVLDFTPSDQLGVDQFGVGEQETFFFNYTIQDDNGPSSLTGTGTYEVTLTGVNDRPEAFDDAITVDENSIGNGNVILGTADVAVSNMQQDTDVDTSDQPEGVLTLERVIYDGQKIFSAATTEFTFLTDVGEVTVRDDGSFTFTPIGDDLQQGATDSDFFDYRVKDDSGARDRGRITLTKNGINHAPVAVDDFDLDDAADPTDNLEDSFITGNVLTGENAGGNPDTDPDSVPTNDTLTVESFVVGGVMYAAGVTATFSHGTVRVDSDGTYTVDPNDRLDVGENHLLELTYTVTDSVAPLAGTDEGALQVEIVGQEDAPTAVDDAINFDEDDTNLDTINVLDGSASAGGVADSDPDDSDILRVIEVVGQQVGILGTISITSDGTATFVPDNAALQYLARTQQLSANFTYEMTDGESASQFADVVITVTGENDTPITVPDSAETSEDANAEFNVIDGTASVGGVADSDIDTNDIPILAVVPINNVAVKNAMNETIGSISINAAGDATFTPDLSLQSLDDLEFETGDAAYDLTDGLITVPGTINIRVTGSNDAPDTVTDVVPFLEESGVINFNVLDGTSSGGNADTDPEGHAISTNIVGPTQVIATDGVTVIGTISIASNGDASFIPNNAALQFLSAGDPFGGTFVYQAKDFKGATSDGTINFQITGENDAPIAVDDSVITNEDALSVDFNVLNGTASAGSVADSDVDANDVLQAVAVTNEEVYALDGTVIGTISILANGQATFVPDPGLQSLGGAPGPAFIEGKYVYSIDDQEGGVTTGNINIRVDGRNDTPTTVADNISILEDQEVVPLFNVLNGEASGGVPDSDIDEDFVQAVTLASGQVVGGLDGVTPIGTININSIGNATFTPLTANLQYLNQGQQVVEQFTYQATDGFPGSVSDGTINITITGENDDPTTAGILDTSTDEGAALNYDVSAQFSDPDSEAILTFSLDALTPSWVSIDENSGVLSGVPLNDDVGGNEVRVIATDQFGATVDAGFDITVNNTNDPPTVDPIADTALNEDAPLNYDVSGSFDDVDVGDDLIFTLDVLTPAWISIDENTGILTGTPLNDDVGVNPVTVIATDIAGQSAQDSFSITVNNTNDPPVINGFDVGNPVTVTENNNASLVTVFGNLLVTDVDAGDSNRISSMNGIMIGLLGVTHMTTYGSIIMPDNGGGVDSLSFTYTLDQTNEAVLRQNPGDPVLVDTIEFYVEDESGAPSQFGATLTINIEGTLSAPFDALDNYVNFNNLVIADYVPGSNLHNAGDGNDNVILPEDQAASDASGYGVLAGSTFLGGGGNDRISGSSLNDIISGQSGDDVLDGGSGGYDTLSGQEGDDTIIVNAGGGLFKGGTEVDGSIDNDTLSFANADSMPLFIIPEPGAAAVTDTYTFGGVLTTYTHQNFENVIGTPSADLIYGSSGGNVISGGPGDDIIVGKGSVSVVQAEGDMLTGGPGADDFYFGDNTVVGNGSFNTITDFQLVEDDLIFLDVSNSDFMLIDAAQMGADYHITYYNFASTQTVVLQGITGIPVAGGTVENLVSQGIDATVV